MLRNNSAKWLTSVYPSKAAREFITRAYRTAFGGAHGEAVLHDLKAACHVLATTTINSPKGGHIDPYQMAINEGRRQAYLHIAGILEITGVDLAPTEKPAHDYRDDERSVHEPEYRPRYGAGFDPTLDGPIVGSSSGESGSSSDTGSGGDA